MAEESNEQDYGSRSNLDHLSGLMNEVPRERKEDAKDTVLQVGDKVEINVGPATGRKGTVVIERNGNYVDYESDSNDEGIAVRVDGEEVPRWFDSADQLTKLES